MNSNRLLTEREGRTGEWGAYAKTTTPESNDVIGSRSKNNRAARAARTLSQFFDVVCQMTT